MATTTTKIADAYRGEEGAEAMQVHADHGPIDHLGRAGRGLARRAVAARQEQTDRREYRPPP